LKYIAPGLAPDIIPRLSPHGESGLKSTEGVLNPQEGTVSLPAWGEWIEIPRAFDIFCMASSLPAWGEWIEIFIQTPSIRRTWSLPAWGEWIEMRL